MPTQLFFVASFQGEIAQISRKMYCTVIYIEKFYRPMSELTFIVHDTHEILLLDYDRNFTIIDLFIKIE